MVCRNEKFVNFKRDDDGMIDIVALMDILARQQVNNVMVEKGARVITSFIRLKLVDMFVITVAPKLVGGLPVIDARRIKNASHIALTDIHYQRLGGDLVVWARPNWSNDEAESCFTYAAPSETKIIAEAMLGVGLAEV